MGFVKLDSGLLTSTLWAHREQREVFITALLMAEPMEILEPTPTLEVDSLRDAGYVVPPGWYGFVPASGPGIIRQAIVKAAPGMAALRALGEPDAESRSKDHGGRRLVRVDGGFILLNYFKYRDKDYTAPDRMRRYRARQKGDESIVTGVTRNRRNATRNVTQADADADADVEVHQPPSVSGAAAGAEPAGVSLPMASGHWAPTPELLLRWKAVWPELDVLAEMGRIADYLAKHPQVRYGEARLVPWVEAWLAKEAAGRDRPARAAPRSGPPLRAQARPQVAAMKSPKLERVKPGGTP